MEGVLQTELPLIVSLSLSYRITALTAVMLAVHCLPCSERQCTRQTQAGQNRLNFTCDFFLYSKWLL